MKIVFFTYLLLEYGGGVARYFTTVALGLKNKYPNNMITILTFDKKLLYFVLFMYSLYFTKKSDFNFKKEISKLKKINYQKSNNIFSIKKILEENDVIYTTNNLLEVIILKLSSFFIKIPPIIIGFHIPMVYPHTHSIQSRFHNILYGSMFYTYLIKDASAFHVINLHDYKLLKHKFPRKKIQLIYNPLTIEKTAKTPVKLFQFNKSKVNILWLGRITEQKGIHDLLQIIKKVNEMDIKNKITWNIVGSGDMGEEIKEISKQYENIHYFGYIQNKYTPYFYKSCDVLISTSLWEGFPFNILEAQSMGLPVICYDIPGCNDIVVNNKTGYTVNSINEFQEKIISCIIRNPFKKIIIRNYIKSSFNNELIYRELFNLFFSIK